MAAVGLGAGHDERGGVHLAPQQAGRVELLGVDVLRVAGERERQAGDRRGQPGDGRRAVREVRVQPGHVAGPVEPVGQVHGTKELEDVELAGSRPEPAPCADRLGECLAGRSGQTHGVAPSGADDRGEEQSPVRSEPTGQLRPGQRCRLQQVLGPRPHPAYDVVVDVFVGRLDDVEAKRDAETLHAVDLAGDEHLGEPWVALEDIGDAARPGCCLRHRRASDCRTCKASRCSMNRRVQAARSKCASTWRRPAAASVARSAGALRVSRASASAWLSPGRTTRPLPAARTVGPRAETSETTSGRPLAIASRATLGSPSRSPLLSTTEGTATTSAQA